MKGASKPVARTRGNMKVDLFESGKEGGGWREKLVCCFNRLKLDLLIKKQWCKDSVDQWRQNARDKGTPEK